ncbi:MAG: hypothetical protein KAU12_03005 [Candidatus Omnitrophica bacterium]|nr:hypothetical protein [Candidatus Omnitrophota bacterium]
MSYNWQGSYVGGWGTKEADVKKSEEEEERRKERASNYEREEVSRESLGT